MNKKILTFEDEEMLRQMYVTKFENAGFQVVAYEHPPATAEKLIELVLSEKPDLIITDIIMPVMDGFQEIKILKAHEETKYIPIIGLDNLGQQEDIDHILEAGAIDYLIKADHTPPEVIAIITEFFRDPIGYNPQSRHIRLLPDNVSAIIEILLLKKTEIFAVLNGRIDDVKKYISIKEQFESGIDVRDNREFQALYVDFYKLGQARLGEVFINGYFELLQDKPSEMDEVLTALYAFPTSRNPHTFQLSFASKLLHTVNNNLPLYDTIVAKQLKLYDQAGINFEMRFKNRLEIYDQLKRSFEALLLNKDVRALINDFRLKFGFTSKQIGDVKVLDFIIWANGQV